MRIMVEVSRAFTAGSPPPSFVTLARRLEIPEALAHQIACSLVHANLLVEANQGDTGFLPARPPDSLRVADVLEAMRQGSVAAGSTEPDALRRALESELWKVSEAERRAGSRTLADLVAMGS
jgi:DNA-binding IscR family transcriptional regulator